jgi:hypothetical protein
MAKSNISDLNTAIYLLAQAATNLSPQNSQCLKLLITALLTRFSYTGDLRDVQIAGAIQFSLAGLTSDTSTLNNILRSSVSDFHFNLVRRIEMLVSGIKH